MWSKYITRAGKYKTNQVLKLYGVGFVHTVEQHYT